MIFTPTGHSLTQAGLAHSMQRVASHFTSSTPKPRFTSSKLCARMSGSRSGICCRAIFIRSFIGTGLLCLISLIAGRALYFAFADCACW